MSSLAETIERLPEPFKRESFSLLRRGVHDCTETEVYLNEESDFAFLYPRPEFSYVFYKSRMVTLNLTTYKKTLPVVQRRLEKVEPWFRDAASVLEVGAADAAFLAHLGERLPGKELASLEIDENTRAGRDAVPSLTQYETFEQVDEDGRHFDVICMFHVLEHIFEPAELLSRCLARLAPGGRLVIEVPSLDDPLLSLYRNEAYQRFYFQRQHPYAYSARSLTRMLDAQRLDTENLVHHQRYGLENHLQWLAEGTPGGNETLQEIFQNCDGAYTESLERAGRTDAIIAIAGPRRARGTHPT